MLERSKKPLIAHRYYAREALDSWNIAALGEYWPEDDSGAVRVENMYWLRLSFEKESDGIKFNEDVKKLVTIFTGRMEDYRKDLQRIRGTVIVSR